MKPNLQITGLQIDLIEYEDRIHEAITEALSSFDFKATIRKAVHRDISNALNTAVAESTHFIMHEMTNEISKAAALEALGSIRKNLKDSKK